MAAPINSAVDLHPLALQEKFSDNVLKQSLEVQKYEMRIFPLINLVHRSRAIEYLHRHSLYLSRETLKVCILANFKLSETK